MKIRLVNELLRVVQVRLDVFLQMHFRGVYHDVSSILPVISRIRAWICRSRIRLKGKIKNLNVGLEQGDIKLYVVPYRCLTVMPVPPPEGVSHFH